MYNLIGCARVFSLSLFFCCVCASHSTSRSNNGQYETPGYLRVWNALEIVIWIQLFLIIFAHIFSQHIESAPVPPISIIYGLCALSLQFDCTVWLALRMKNCDARAPVCVFVFMSCEYATWATGTHRQATINVFFSSPHRLYLVLKFNVVSITAAQKFINKN